MELFKDYSYCANLIGRVCIPRNIWRQRLIKDSGIIFAELSDLTIVLSEHDMGEYCQFDTFRAQCFIDEVILITHAHYGTMRVGKCINKEIGTFAIIFKILSY